MTEPTKLKDMTAEEIGALWKAFYDGERILWWDGIEWVDDGYDTDFLDLDECYKIHKEPPNPRDFVDKGPEGFPRMVDVFFYYYREFQGFPDRMALDKINEHMRAVGLID